MQFSRTTGLSVNTSTNPNLTGHGVLDDMKGPGIDWKTLGEYLEEANITWNMYHEMDDFGCDAFAWFDQYKHLQPGDPLYDKGIAKSQNLTDDFRKDVSEGNLPQVSLIMAPQWLSEHAIHHPADGMKLTSDLLKVLEENPTVY
jgi:phospholipase C